MCRALTVIQKCVVKAGSHHCGIVGNDERIRCPDRISLCKHVVMMRDPEGRYGTHSQPPTYIKSVLIHTFVCSTISSPTGSAGSDTPTGNFEDFLAIVQRYRQTLKQHFLRGTCYNERSSMYIVLRFVFRTTCFRRARRRGRSGTATPSAASAGSTPAGTRARPRTASAPPPPPTSPSRSSVSTIVHEWRSRYVFLIVESPCRLCWLEVLPHCHSRLKNG